MKFIGKIWKVILALILLGAAVYLYFGTYQTEKTAYETKTQQMQIMIASLQKSIAENTRYADVQDKLEEANAAVDASRLELYEHFPVQMKEEDQIMYVLYLETLFGTEINFSFSQAQPYVALRDGSTLMALVLEVNYETTYQGFKDMVNYLSTDERITSVYASSIEYDAKKDVAKGRMQLVLYLMNSDLLEYLPPDVAEPETGKDSVFD
jgi:hypothetical protein